MLLHDSNTSACSWIFLTNKVKLHVQLSTPSLIIEKKARSSFYYPKALHFPLSISLSAATARNIISNFPAANTAHPHTRAL